MICLYLPAISKFVSDYIQVSGMMLSRIRRVPVRVFSSSTSQDHKEFYLIILITVQQLTMAHKRSNSSLDDPASQPKKMARTETIPAATDALLSARARIAELEDQVLDLHAFIDANGLTRSKFLFSVQPSMV